jgi:hypothetical protein
LEFMGCKYGYPCFDSGIILAKLEPFQDQGWRAA